MPSKRVLLLDDEPKSLLILEDKLNRLFPAFEIVGQFTDPELALNKLPSLKPDIVFLDIAMPRMSGFEFLKQIPEPDFELIFVTAFGDYAIEAIKHAAVGYLVKPFLNEDLIQAVNNALRNLERKSSKSLNLSLKESLLETDITHKRLVIPFEDGLIFSEYHKIIRLEGENGYTRIFFNDGTNVLSAYSIGYFYEMLNKTVFFQCHKSHIINLNCITRYLNEGMIELNGKETVPLSRTKKAEFLAVFNR